MKQENELSYLYRQTLRQITAYGNEWVRFLKFASRLYPFSFENLVLLYGQNRKATMLATTEQWSDMGRAVQGGSKGAFAFGDDGTQVTGTYLFDISQTTGVAVPDHWRLVGNNAAAFLRKVPHADLSKDSAQQSLHEMMWRNLYTYAPVAREEFKRGLRNRSYPEKEVRWLGYQFQGLLWHDVKYIVGSRCEFPATDVPARAKFATVHAFNRSTYAATYLGRASLNMARALIRHVERTIQLSAREKMIYETELYQEGKFTLSRGSNLERPGGRPAIGTVGTTSIPGVEEGLSRPLYGLACSGRVDGSTAQGRGGRDAEGSGAVGQDGPGGGGTGGNEGNDRHIDLNKGYGPIGY